jgi:hypothetical protein
MQKLEQKRLEHERQRLAQQRAFEEQASSSRVPAYRSWDHVTKGVRAHRMIFQMKALEQQQAAEEAELLASSSSSSESPERPSLSAAATLVSKKKASASAPATPPRSPSVLGSSSDEEVDPEAYKRMTQSVAEIARKRTSFNASPEAAYSDGDSPEVGGHGFGLKSKSKSGTDLPGFSASFLASPAQRSSTTGAGYGTKTVPNSPVTYMNGMGSNGHIGSGQRKSNPQSKSVPGSRRPSDSDADEKKPAMTASLNLADGLSKLNVNGCVSFRLESDR